MLIRIVAAPAGPAKHEATSYLEAQHLREYHVGAGRCERLQTVLEMIGPPQVVVVEKRDITSAGELTSDIVRSRLLSEVLGEIDEPDARVFEAADDVHGVVGTAVTNNQQLPVSMGLPAYRLDREPQDIGSVVSRDDD